MKTKIKISIIIFLFVCYISYQNYILNQYKTNFKEYKRITLEKEKLQELMIEVLEKNLEQCRKKLQNDTTITEQTSEPTNPNKI